MKDLLLKLGELRPAVAIHYRALDRGLWQA